MHARSALTEAWERPAVTHNFFHICEYLRLGIANVIAVAVVAIDDAECDRKSIDANKGCYLDWRPDTACAP